MGITLPSFSNILKLAPQIITAFVAIIMPICLSLKSHWIDSTYNLSQAKQRGHLKHGLHTIINHIIQNISHAKFRSCIDIISIRGDKRIMIKHCKEITTVVCFTVHLCNNLFICINRRWPCASISALATIAAVQKLTFMPFKQALPGINYR